MLQNVRFTRCLATRPSLFGKGVIMKTPGVRHSAGHSEFPDPRCPPGRNITDLTSNSQDLMSTFSRLSTSANSSPVHPLAVKTVPRVSGCSNLSTSANTMASTSDAPSLPLGVRTVPDNARTLSQMQSSPRKKKYYVVIVGKCAGIYYEHW